MYDDSETTTVQGSLRALRAQWRVIVGVLVLCVAVAVGVSLAAQKTYTATAAISVTDPNTDLGLVGGLAGSTQTPQQLASAHASQVLRDTVLSIAIRNLGLQRSVASLRGSLSVQVDPNSALVDVTAKAGSAGPAAALANAVARADVHGTVAAARAGYAHEAQHLAAQTGSSAANNNPGVRVVYAEQLSRLQALSAVASPVVVSSLAQAPTSASSPKPLQNAVIAAFIGLFLGIGAGTLRSSLDRRLRSAREIEKRIDLPLVGHVRRTAMGQAVGLTSGANGSVAYTPADLETFRMLRQNLLFLDDALSMRSVVVTSAMPAEGKTTVAASLALASAAAGKLTLLVECDLRRPVLAERLGVAAAPGLADYLLGTAGPQEVLRVVPSGGRAPGAAAAAGGDTAKPLVCIPGGTHPEHPAELLGSERFRRFLSAASEMYDFIVIDSPPLLAVVDALELIPLASGVLLCVRLSQTTEEQMLAAREALARLPKRPTGLVVSDLAPGDAEYGYEYYYTGSP
jgi:Mrp family chromosome partitioning ATPase/capsular polysaccharide biosynthesis protein